MRKLTRPTWRKSKERWVLTAPCILNDKTFFWTTHLGSVVQRKDNRFDWFRCPASKTQCATYPFWAVTEHTQGTRNTLEEAKFAVEVGLSGGPVPVTLTKRWVIHSLELGIYLGGFLGMGFWSKLDPAGQTSAVTFETSRDARCHMASWESRPENLFVCEVECVDLHATIDELVSTGLPGWEP
jgi:hypothetical protein